MVLDLSEGNGGRQTLHRYEANHLWESKISGLLIENCKDYITFSKDGINIIALGNQETKAIKDNLGIDKVLHSLDSQSYLKLDSLNFLNFRCQDHTNREMAIEQESTRIKNGEVQTFYDTIYKIKIHEITLRELLIFTSFYVSKTATDIVMLIKK